MYLTLLIIIFIIIIIFSIYYYKSSRLNSSGSYIFKDRVLKNTKNSKILNVPPRRMWGWGSYANNEVGYCGETAAQQSFIYHGNYISQAQVNKCSGGSFLPSVNSTIGYRRLQVIYDDCNVGNNWQDLFAYIKNSIDNYYPIVAGLYVLEEGDQDYDHVCVIYGYDIDDKGNLTKIYYNDAYQLIPLTMDCTLDDKGIPKCLKKRDEFKESSDNTSAALLPCMLPNVSGKKNPDGSPVTEPLSTIQGNVDPLKELYPVLLEMVNPYEANWGSEDQVCVTSLLGIECKVHIGNLVKDKNYTLLRFDTPDDLPVEGGFLANTKWTLRINFKADKDTFIIPLKDTQDYPFKSNGTYFFRCVDNTDPTNQYKSVYSVGSNVTDISPDFSVLPTKYIKSLCNSQYYIGEIAEEYNDRNTKIITSNNGRNRKLLYKKPCKPRAAAKKQKKNMMNKNKVIKNMMNRDILKMNYTSSSDGDSIFGDKCSSEKPVPPNVSIYTAANIPNFSKDTDPDTVDLGTINKYWNWHFPPPVPGWSKAPNVGCVKLVFTPTPRAFDEYPSIMKFTVSTLNDDDNEKFSPTDSKTDPDAGDDNDGFIGVDGRIYMGCDELQVFMAFSLYPRNSDGSFTMVSADGVTISRLVPVQGN